MAGLEHPVFAKLRLSSRNGPLVVAHRGDSTNFPENTLPAFQAARDLGVPMQEFDVRCTRDGVLVCCHDATLDRTSDAALELGAGALVAQTTLAELQRVDAGAWRGPAHRGTRVPTLAAALEVMLPHCVPLVEHKAGEARAFVDELHRCGALGLGILQSFDWDFVRAARRESAELAVAVLGPTEQHPAPDDAALALAIGLGAGMVHWHARHLRWEDVARIHAAGMLLCTYTTDDDAGLCGGAALGFDAMCTNVPARMLALQRSGRLRRGMLPPTSPDLAG